MSQPMTSSLSPQFYCHMCTSGTNEDAREHAINTHNCTVDVVDEFVSSKSLDDLLAVIISILISYNKLCQDYKFQKLFAKFENLNDAKLCPLCKINYDDMESHIRTEHGISKFLEKSASSCAASEINDDKQSVDPDTARGDCHCDSLVQHPCFICNSKAPCDIEHLTTVHKFFVETAEIVVTATDHTDVRKKFSEHYDRILRKEPIWGSLRDWDRRVANKQKTLDAKFARLSEQTMRIAELNVISRQCLEETKIVEIVEKLTDLAEDPEMEENWTEINNVVKNVIIDRPITHSSELNEEDMVDSTEKCKVMSLYRQIEQLLLQILALMQLVTDGTKFVEETQENRSDSSKHQDLLEIWQGLMNCAPTMESEMKTTMTNIFKPLNDYMKLDREWKEATQDWVESNEDFIKTIHWYYCLIKYSQDTKKLVT